MKIAVISASLSTDSNSRRLARSVARTYAETAGVEVDWIDLAEHILPLCDGGAAYGHPQTTEIGGRLGAADAFVIATPIYNYTVNAALKNLTELAGRKMAGKLVGFLVAAGGSMSYMAVMPYANSLMLDFRSIILPRFVYATDEDWEGESLTPELQSRLAQFEQHFLELARKLTP